jgi:hypothetical protein
MAVTQLSPIVRHAALAKRLLATLQEQTEATMNLIGGDTPTEFFAALEERDRLLGELNGVVEAMTRERVSTGRERQMQVAVIHEIVQAAAAVFASHGQLAERVLRERDRLAEAVERSNKPDTVANQYSGYGMRRSAGLSVTG